MELTLVGSETPYPLMKKILTDKSQHKKNSETNKSTLFFYTPGIYAKGYIGL